LAVDGHVVYTSTCASCHGGDGQGGVGPALWGQYYVPGMYNGTKLFNNNAQDMLTFIETNMPFSSAGSLTHQQAIDVLCYLLIQENEISPSDIFIESQLSSVILN
jgi:cytochrome c